MDLPRQQKVYGFEQPARREIEADVAEFRGTLDELGEITVAPVSSRYAKESKVWFALLDRHHYLGSSLLCGAQIRYVVRSSTHGCLGALAFSGAAWALKARDKYIGWTEAARRANLPLVVQKDRFLLVPTVHGKNLASHVLSLVLRLLPEDWEQRYHMRPVLADTFVDPIRFAGTCYKAANWTQVGETAGRRDGVAKKIFVYPLCPKWREVLCTEPPISLGDRPRPEAPAHCGRRGIRHSPVV